jgi:dTDP-4-amino-4,6-dideoxygalactose transaminase
MEKSKLYVPAIDLSLEYKVLQKTLEKALKRVFESGWFLLGKELASFEQEFAKYLGVKYALGVSSGTDALTIALKSLDLNKEDEVIIPANVYPTVFGVNLSGVKIKLADVNNDSLNIDLENIRRVYTKKVKAIVVVHLYGNPVDLDPIIKFAKEKSLYLIEDCAQAAGAIYKDKRVGSFGDINCFSFYPTKNLGSFGDGGIITTNNKKLAEKVKLWRMYGEVGRYNSILPGFNSRLSEIQSAVLKVKLKYLEKFNKKRIKLAKKYQQGLKDLPVKIVHSDNIQSVYHLLVIQTSKRDSLMKFMQDNGVGVGVHYPYPIHLVESFKSLGKKGDFPISEESSKNILTLPIYSQMIESQVECVISKMEEFFNSKK